MLTLLLLLCSWPNITRLLGTVIVGVEVRQVLINRPVDQGLLLLAAGLLGLGAALRRNGGNGQGGSG